jgi:negative modulator of initiation of replication
VKKIDISDDVYEELKRLTSDFHQSPNDVLADLLNVRSLPDSADEPLVAHLLSADFRTKFTDADKYLAILGWIAARHAAEFKEFILSLSGSPSGRRFLGMTREEIVEQCRHNQARQIPNTRYWAIMNIDTATKRRFLSRVLEFIGYREGVIEFACGVIGIRRSPRRGALLPLLRSS